MTTRYGLSDVCTVFSNQLAEVTRMAGFFRHTLFLFVLAAACYVMAVYVTGGRIAFIVFFVAGVTAELVFWILFWRQRRISRRNRAQSHA